MTKNSNKCKYCNRELGGLTPCNCGGNEKYTVKLWDYEKRRYDKRKEKGKENKNE